MQKKIIALAVAGLVSGGAFAQTNVTISGNIDAGWLSSKNEGSTAGETAAAFSNATTSQMFLQAREDLGGGMYARVFTETLLDFTSAATAGIGTWGGAQKYVAMGGGFGEISFGQRNNYNVTSAVTAQPFGTGIGSGYSGAFGRLDGGGTNAAGTYAAFAAAAGTRDLRANNSIRYDSVRMGGFSFGVTLRDKNDSTEVGTTYGHMNIGLGYNAGPFNAAYSYTAISNPTAAVVSVGTLKHNMLAANYNFGPVTVYGGYTTSKGDAAAANDTSSRSWNIAAKYAVTSKVDLMANFLRDNDKTVGDNDRRMNALGANYSFSKRTATYFRYEGGDNTTSNAAIATGGKFTRYALGMYHNF